MGQEIQSTHFSSEDFRIFSERLKAETELLRQSVLDGGLKGQGEAVGFELEAWLVDRLGLPSPVNESFLQCLNNPNVVPELSRFNVEFNSRAYPVGPRLLSRLRGELTEVYRLCRACAEKLDSKVLLIGILPTLRPEMLSIEHMSPLKRFSALNEQILRLRHGRPFHLDIQGQDHLVMSHGDVMLESAATSLQIHLQSEATRSVRVHNAAMVASAPMVALAANSPFLFQKDLWDETRIPLFEQAVDLEGDLEDHPTMGRVGFGSGYVRSSLMECFEENLKNFPVLLPILFDSPPEELRHLHLHNGTIWRWNRPIVASEAGAISLRVEHRVAASGPSIPDILANLAFFLGLMEELSRIEPRVEQQLPFEKARDNFYRAAREGLHARIDWLNGHKASVATLILTHLIPLAAKGLQRIGIDRSEVEFYLQEVLAERVKSGQNGASWQRHFIQRHGQDFLGLTEAYLGNQMEGKPVHLWA